MPDHRLSLLNTRALILIGLATVALWLAAPAHAAHISCGQTITSDAVLDSDLVCSDRGIVIGAAGITLDLDGHRITGAPQSSPRTAGIDNRGGHDGVRIGNGVIANFRAGVRLTNAEANRVADLVITGAGVEMINAHRNTVAGLVVNTVFSETEVTLVGSTENNFVGNSDTSIRLDLDSDRNTITDNAGGLYFMFNGSDDNVFTGNRDVSIDASYSKRATITANELRTVQLTDGDDSVIVSNDVVGSSARFGLRIAASSGVRIDGNSVSDPLPTSSSGGGFGRDALLLHQSPDNTVVENELRGYEVGIELVGDADRNLISENVISGNDVSGIRLYLARDNSIESNELTSNGEYGIEFQLASNLNRIERNTISASGVDGIFVSAARSQDNVFAENSISGSGDDGIDTDIVAATITANSAFENGDWGIEAAAGTIDGGANRGWSNGQPAQCLNIVCGPGPPASLALTPESATNTVGDEHCVTATVADPDGRATPGETVRFSVDGDGAATAETDAGGTATFCYEGPLTPGTDEIAAFADTDGDATQDAGEPADTATKTWVVPAAERCKVTGAGTLTAANGDDAHFTLSAHVTPARLHGRHTYRDFGPAERVLARSRTIESVTCAGDRASIYGTVVVSGTAGALRFRIDVADSPNTYRIRLSNGYDSGQQSVAGGNIRVQ